MNLDPYHSILTSNHIYNQLNENTNEEVIDSIKKMVESDQCLDQFTSKTLINNIILSLTGFLKNKGNPFSLISHIKVRDKEFDQLSIIELVYLLRNGKSVYSCVNWPETIEEGLDDMINTCNQKINEMLSQNLVKDEDFIPLIKCAIEFSDMTEKKELPIEENIGSTVLCVFEYFVIYKVNPNLLFATIQIGNNIYSNLTCLHVVYLLWKEPSAIWNDFQEERFQGVIDALLADRRTDLTAQFSERSLETHHFVNSKNFKFYQQFHDKNHNGVHFFYPIRGIIMGQSLGNEPDEILVDEMEGHSLEIMTIAHCAIVLQDYVMLTRFLDQEPRLLNMTCCMTKGKKWRNQSFLNELEKNDQLSGTFKSVPFLGIGSYCKLVRITKVSLLHLAARVGRDGVLACLTSRHANPAVVDSENRTPQHYLKLSADEGSIAKDRTFSMMFNALNLVTRYTASLPEVNKFIHHNGYDIVYNTSRKVAFFSYQRLRKNTFGEAQREGKRWRENPTIPLLNRAKDNDYTNSGLHRGHLSPANDATGSDERMIATFNLENAVPQNPSLNSGAWSRLESHVHKLTQENDLVEVFTGPLFVPNNHQMIHGTIGMGEVHVPTHLFKIIYLHNRSTTKEVYILPNQKLLPNTKFTQFKSPDPDSAIAYIQKYSGILFNEWKK